MAGACGETPRQVAASTGSKQRPGIRARWFGHALSALMDSEIQIFRCGLAQQAQEDLQSDAVGIGGIKLDLGGKHSCLMESLNAYSLAFSCLSNRLLLCLSP
jgi:hypothetical protein